MKPIDPILVVGAGSIGERYIRNLWRLGHRNIAVLRKRNFPFRDIGEAEVTVINSWVEVDQIKPFAAFICTPTFLHLENALACAERGIHVLVEKPLSHSLSGIDQLISVAKKNKVYVQVGYMMRYYPWLQEVRALVQASTFGKLQYMSSYWGEYLPDWHPWEDYRGSYAAQREMGGGVALTLSHDLDVCNWLADAAPYKWSKLLNNTAKLDVNVESGADFLLHYPAGIGAHVHLNFYQRVKERWYQYIFDEAVIRINFFTHERTIKTATEEKADRLDDFDRNDLFVAQIEYFFKSLEIPFNSEKNLRESARIIEICTE